MSEIVERLAKRWATETGEREDVPILRSDARWWLQAIADEVDSHEGLEAQTEDVARWLRQEAEK